MSQSFYLENMVEAQKHIGARRFIIPTSIEIDNLSVGNKVRLFFIFNFKTEDGCRAERMWVEISEIKSDRFQGYLTNQPVYIKDLHMGDVIEFSRENIATTIMSQTFDEQKKAFISRRAIEKKEVNWLYRTPSYHNEDSGWNLFYGDEDEEYNSHADNIVIVSLEQVLSMEPRLEEAFASSDTAFEWNEEDMKFVIVE